jgi:hypothetical protein
MGQTLSLFDVMNDVAASFEKGAGPASFARREPMSEMQAFDPLLADLHKKHADARAIRLQAEKEFGSHDGMTEMAMMTEDSAWCALQTRYLELRADRGLMERVQKAMAADRADEERLTAIEKDKEQKERMAFIQLFARMRPKKSDDADLLFWLMILFCKNERFPWFGPVPVTHAFNRLSV